MENPPRWRIPTEAASLFGKLPTVLDYVRVNHSYPAAIALDEWLSRALQELTVASVSWSKQRYRFLFASPAAEHALVGVVAASRDRAGRKFPLCIFAPLPVEAIAGDFAAAPLACDALLTAAEKLLDQAATLTREDAEAKLPELPLPGPQDFSDARKALHDALVTRPAAQFAAELFPDGAHQAEDAYARVVATVSKVRSAPPERVSVLDCPVGTAEDVGAWLTLCQRMLAWKRAVPSLFWTTEAEPGRLLVSLGTPPPTLTLWLSERKRKSERLVALGGGRVSSPSPADAAAPPLFARAPEGALRPPARGTAHLDTDAPAAEPASAPPDTHASLPDDVPLDASTEVENVPSPEAAPVLSPAAEETLATAPVEARGSAGEQSEAAHEQSVAAHRAAGEQSEAAREQSVAASLLHKLCELSAP